MKDAKAKHVQVKLDWSRLLGFDQADAGARGAGERSLRLAKVGTKTGTKIGTKSRAIR